MTRIDGGSWAQESPIGKAGRVITATRGGSGPGEVELEIRGGVEVFIARSPGPLAKGTAVICVSTLGPRSLVVLPWADPKDGFAGSLRRAEVALADGLAESPLESLSRLHLARAGAPTPVLPAEIVDGEGWLVARVDFLWPEVRGGGRSRRQFEVRRPGGVARRAAAGAVAARPRPLIVRWEWRHLYQFGIVVARLRAAFGRGLPLGSPQRQWGGVRRS